MDSTSATMARCTMRSPPFLAASSFTRAALALAPSSLRSYAGSALTALSNANFAP